MLTHHRILGWFLLIQWSLTIVVSAIIALKGLINTDAMSNFFVGSLTVLFGVWCVKKIREKMDGDEVNEPGHIGVFRFLDVEELSRNDS